MSKTPLRIIIIDDNPDIQHDFIKILQITNQSTHLSELNKQLFGELPVIMPINHLPHFEIEVTSQGEEGVKKIKQALDEDHPFALAFVDIRMPPGIDGIETIKQIWDYDPEIQVVICTAYSDYSWEDTLKVLGLSDNLFVLKKPFDVDSVRQLASALTQKWLLSRKTRQHALALNRLVEERTHSLKQSMALLRATIESSFDGILVVDLKGKIIDFNKQFVKYLNVPEYIFEQNDEINLFHHVIDQVEEPKKLIRIVLMHRKKIEGSSRLILGFKNKKTYECYSKPHYVGKKIEGRVWSFHDITEQEHLKEKLEYQATHDVLTGLPNRSLLIDRIGHEIDHALRSDTQFAVLFFDVDRFKLINDTLSHEIGDELLCAVSRRLTSLLRKVDTIARIGGDEFVLIFPLVKNEGQVMTLGQKLLELFHKPFHTIERKIKISVSIGISIYPTDGTEVNTLLSKADLAMYQAKTQGGDQFVFFTEELNQKSDYQFQLEAELQRAVRNEEFFLIYQPQFDIHSQQIISIEALLRWNHPEKGVILPSDFIPIAESSGLIVPIGEWAMREACQQLNKWRKKGMAVEKIAVNVATKQLRQHDFPITVFEIVKFYQLDPSNLEIELTENVIFDKQIQETLLKFKKMGCTIVLDDFGSSNSSINILKKFHIDRLKIDRSLVQNISKSAGDETIVQAIIAISHSMNFKVIAEGVETENQMDFLKRNSCDAIQGFIWSKPLSAKEIETVISNLKKE